VKNFQSALVAGDIRSQMAGFPAFAIIESQWENARETGMDKEQNQLDATGDGLRQRSNRDLSRNRRPQRVEH
jgi:hypothetical protein